MFWIILWISAVSIITILVLVTYRAEQQLKRARLEQALAELELRFFCGQLDHDVIAKVFSERFKKR